jgi:hypothetical protein
MMKQIKILVAPNGQTRVETKGFTGNECREASKFLEQALGQQTAEKLTAEFYAENSEQANIQEGA